jgi:NADPH:quinone reductase-like Zn-dependent oxidoreductase
MSGQEFAGIVEEVGTKVTALKVGDAVLGHKIPFRVRYRHVLEMIMFFFSPFKDCI